MQKSKKMNSNSSKKFAACGILFTLSSAVFAVLAYQKNDLSLFLNQSEKKNGTNSFQIETSFSSKTSITPMDATQQMMQQIMQQNAVMSVLRRIAESGRSDGFATQPQKLELASEYFDPPSYK